MPVLFINQSTAQNVTFDISDRFNKSFILRCLPIKEFGIYKVINNGIQVDD